MYNFKKQIKYEAEEGSHPEKSCLPVSEPFLLPSTEDFFLFWFIGGSYWIGWEELEQRAWKSPRMSDLILPIVIFVYFN